MGLTADENMFYNFDTCTPRYLKSQGKSEKTSGDVIFVMVTSLVILNRKKYNNGVVTIKEVKQSSH
jgi:hypothetical protein